MIYIIKYLLFRKFNSLQKTLKIKCQQIFQRLKNIHFIINKSIRKTNNIIAFLRFVSCLLFVCFARFVFIQSSIYIPASIKYNKPKKNKKKPCAFPYTTLFV